MANLSLREVAQSQLDQAPVIDGQLIVCTDTGSTYRDIGTRRIQISKDLEIVSSLPLAPLSNKIYYLRPDSLYVYSGDDWILLNPSKFTLEADKNAVNGEVNINLILNGTAQDKIKIAGGGVTTVTTGETGDITIDTPHPDELLAALTNDEIDAITGGMVDDSGNPLPTPQVVVDATLTVSGRAADEKKSWLDRAGAVHLWKTIEAMLGTKVDKIEGFGLSSNDYTTEEKKKLASLSDPDVATTENNGLMSSADKAKLDGIEAGANNYTHPVYEAKQAGLYRISVDNTGHVATADKMTSEELTAEGVSPADHTHDLGKLVNTLETSADAVEDADTVMVGAIVTSDDGSATTKYTRRPLAALWNWIKSRTDTLYAAAGHNHKVNELENYDTHVYNPTLNRTKRTVLAAPTAADGPATFRALDKNDVGLGNVDNVAALPLTGGTMSGQIKRSINTSHIGARDGVPLSNPQTGTSYRPVVGVKSANGYWVMSTYNNDNLRFAYTSDADYSAGTNRETTVLLPSEEGTIITSASIGNQVVAGVKDYNDANTTIKIGWSGTDLNETTLAYIAGYTSDKKIHPASKAGVLAYIGNATSSSSGFMSNGDKQKLDDFYSIVTITKSLKVTTDWMDTGIYGTALSSGTYVVQVSGFTASNTPGLYGETWSGIMTWYSDETNSGNSDEILLHNAGHADNGNEIYLKTLRSGRGGNNLRLQIAARVAATNADNVVFKFRRLI